MLDLNGKKALVIGVANDQSIAWGVAKALHASGAEIAHNPISMKKPSRTCGPSRRQSVPRSLFR